jgi:hypothetical protein
MSRIIETRAIPNTTLVLRTIFQDGSFADRRFKKDDIVTDLRYALNGDIAKVTGRVADIKYQIYQVTRNYSDLSKIKSSFSKDVRPTSIVIDCSTEYHSNLVEIPVREILEKATEVDVARMRCFMEYSADFEIELSDETMNTFSLSEGQYVDALEYLENGGEVLSDAKIVAFRYDSELSPTHIETIIDGKIKELSILAIKSVGTVISPTKSNVPMSQILANPVDGCVYLGADTFTEPLNIVSDLVIMGAKSSIPALPVIRDVKTFANETVLTSPISVVADYNVVLDGLTLTQTAYLSLANAKSVTLRNCIITNLDPDTSKATILKTTTAVPMKVVIKNCYFGNNQITSVGKVYNAFTLNCKLEDGSEFSNNYFEENVNSNNTICIYDVVDGAHILIKNNIWEKSANGVRVGTKGDAICTVDIINNIYYSVDTLQPECAGLLLVQPYNKETTDMSQVVINIDGTQHKDEYQLYYFYTDAGTMQFTESNVPTITVDGVVEVKPEV